MASAQIGMMVWVVALSSSYRQDRPKSSLLSLPSQPLQFSRPRFVSSLIRRDRGKRRSCAVNSSRLAMPQVSLRLRSPFPTSSAPTRGHERAVLLPLFHSPFPLPQSAGATSGRSIPNDGWPHEQRLRQLGRIFLPTFGALSGCNDLTLRLRPTYHSLSPCPL
jgi:hypothetical protein